MIAHISGAGHQISRYEISDREMAVGSTLGGPKAMLLIKATGAVHKLYSPEAGTDAFGTLVLHHWDSRSGIPLIALPGDFLIHPYAQEHVFELSNGVTVEENLFVLNSGHGGADRRDVDPPAAYYTVRLRNDSGESIEMATYAAIRLRGGMGSATQTAFDDRRRAFVASNEKKPEFVRVAACSHKPASYEVTLDSAKTSAAQFPGALSNETLDTSDDPIGIFHLTHRLGARESADFYFVLTFSLDGEEGALQTLRALPAAHDALAATHRYYDVVLNRAVVMTPDQEVNRGVLWAKANMLRTQTLTSQGWCFVNDPTRSNNSVARDTCWYAFGADFVTPDFAGEALSWYADHLEADGMVVEYFDVRNGKTEDYGLNINDNTPLLIIALWHHYASTGDRAFLERLYPQARRAGEYLLSQRNGQGLVWCNADGTADWGIIGWRNVIKDYRLSGATTEVNSESYAALQTLGLMAEELGDSAAAKRYRDEAAALRAAINEHLLDKSRGLYYLNIDLDGTPRTDVTCDMVFPILFGVAEHDVAANIIARMSTPEFWSDAGLHTVPRNDINYGPTHGAGLLGGIWAGPTFWFASAAASFNPEFMAYALSVSFQHYSQDPRRNNTVPGQFSEWLHGETLTNQGMMLSPWFAPKYVWVAIEGAAGLDLSVNPPALTPRPANAWQWIGVHNLRLRGQDVSWFAIRTGEGLTSYATYPFASVAPEGRYERDLTDCVHISGDTTVRIAMQRPDRTVIFIGNTRDRTVTTSVTVNDSSLRGNYILRAYNTLRNEWTEEPNVDAERLRRGLPVQINRRGYCVLELRPEG